MEFRWFVFYKRSTHDFFTTMIAHITNMIKKGAAARGSVLVFFAVLAVAVLSPFLFGDRLMLSADSDALYYYYPAFDFYGTALKAGESFLWNPYLFSGFPTYLSQSAGFLDPVNMILFRFLPNFTAYHVRLAVDVFLVMLFSYLAARAYGISRLAASLVGPSYLLAFHWRFLSNPVITNSLFLLPFLFLVYSRLRDQNRRTWPWMMIGGAGVGWSFLSGYAQLTIYALFLLGLYALIDFIWRGEIKKGLPFFIKRFWPLLGIPLVGFVVGLPQILPALKFLPLTIRSGGLEFVLTTGKSLGLGDFILFLFPDYLYFPYLTAGRKPLFVGALWFLLALFAFFAVKSKKIVAPFAILFGFTLLASLSYSPIFYFLQKLPLFEYFRFPYRWLYLGAWFLAMLGAYGFDAMSGLVDTKRFRRAVYILSGFTGLFGLGVLALNLASRAFMERVSLALHSLFSAFLYGRLGFTKETGHYLDAVRRGAAAWRQSVAFQDFAFLVPFLLLLVSVALVFLWARGRLGAGRFRSSAAALVIIGFLAIFAVQWPLSLPKNDVVLPGTLVDKFIPAEDRLIYRTFPFMLDRGFREKIPPKFALAPDEILELTTLQLKSGWPNTNFYSGISSVDGYDVFVPREYLKDLVAMGSTHGGEDATKSLPEEEKIKRLLTHIPELGRMGGKYIISGVTLEHPKLIFLGSYVASRYQIPIYLYRNIDARPRFYLIDSIDERQPKGEIVPVRPIKIENGYFEFEIEVSKSQQLIVLESNLPGWEARIDGKAANIFPAEGLYMAVEIPQGVHAVTFQYAGMQNELRWLRLLGLVE